MASEIAGRSRSPREDLRRLAIIFKVAIRLKIVTELYMRAMSPKDFYDEFGGGSVERVSQNFEVLEKHGWLRRVGPKPRETKRRGPSETLFRATELAFMDTDMWALMPISVRLASSWTLFRFSARKVWQCVEAAVGEGLWHRDLTCMQLEFDLLGWERVLEKLNDSFKSIFEEQEDTRIRASITAEDPVRAGLFHMGFEYPKEDDRRPLELANGLPEPPVPFLERLASIFADDLLLAILTVLNERDMSVPQFHREFAGNASEAAVRYRFQRLRDLSWIAVIDKVRRRGAYEQIYRATMPLMTDDGFWSKAPEVVKSTKDWTTLMCLSDWTRESISTGTFDVRPNRHVTWSVVQLDRQGRDNVVAGLDALEAFIHEEEKQARKRIEAGADPLTMVVGLGAFESPSGRVKAP